MSVKDFLRKHIIAASAGAVVLGAAAAAIGTQIFNHSSSYSRAAVNASVSENDVKKTIAKHTGISDLTYEKIKLEHDNDYANSHYDVEAYKNNTEYDFEIDALTGRILSYSTDSRDGSHKGKNKKSTANQDETKIIDEGKIKKIVAAETGKNDLNYAYIHLETEDGQQIYDVKAVSGDTEYDFDINAVTGQVLSSDRESISNAGSPRTAASSAKLSENQVKDIVSKTTGQNNLTYTEIKLSQDQDDYAGKLIYEVTAYTGGTEYELDIDANSGQVLSSSAEKDDD